MRRLLAWTAAGAVVVAGAYAVRELRRPHAPPPPPPPPAANDAFGDPLPPYAVARMGTVRRATATCGLAFTPDSRALICGCGDGFVRRFDVATGAMLDELRVRGGFETVPRRREPMSWLTDAFEGRRDEVVVDVPSQMAFSDDGTRIGAVGPASASFDGLKEAWRSRRDGHRPTAVAVAKDGLLCAVGWDDGRMDLVPSGRVIEWGQAPQRIVLSPEGKFAAVQANGVRLLNLEAGAVVSSAPPAKDFAPGGIAFSPDGTRLVHAQGRSGLVLRDAKTFTVLWEKSDPKRVNWGGVAFSPDGRTIAWGMNDIVIVDAEFGAVSHVIDLGGIETWKLAFSPDGARLAATVAGIVRVWDTSNWSETPPLASPTSNVHWLEFSPDGRSLLSRGRSSTVDIWDAATGALRRSVGGGGWSGDAAWTPDGSSVRCVTWKSDGSELVTFDAATGARTDSIPCPKFSRFVVHGPSPMLLRYTQAGPTTGTWDLVDPRTGASIRTLQGSALGGISSPSRDGRHFAATSGSPPLEILDFTTGARVPTGVTWSNGDGTARLIELSPDASLVAAALDHGRVLVAERATGKMRFSADSGLHGAVTSLAISPDGRLLAEGDCFGNVHLWSIADEIELFTLRGHRGSVWTVEFSPDGTHLASGSEDATVLVWDVSGFGKER